MAKFDPFLSLDCARVEGLGAQSKERKGSNFAAQRSGAIFQKPEGPNTHDMKMWLSPSSNLEGGKEEGGRKRSFGWMGGQPCRWQGCQMAKFDPFLFLDRARMQGLGAQSKERKGSNFAA